MFIRLISEAYTLHQASPVAQRLKNLPATQEIRQEELQILSLGQEDPPGKEMATHSSILAWEIQWIEEMVGTWSHKRIGHN